jgi:hypothetical protein
MLVQVSVANEEADEAMAARDAEAAARMSSLRELEASVSRRRAGVSQEELALRKLTAEAREVAAATHLAERKIRSLERGAAARGGSWGKDGVATRAGGSTGAGMAGGAAGGDAALKTAAGNVNAAASTATGARSAAGSAAAGAKLPDHAPSGGAMGGRRESPAPGPDTLGGRGYGSEGAGGGKASSCELARSTEAPPDTIEPPKAVSDFPAKPAIAKLRTVGGTLAPMGVATVASASSVRPSGDSPPPRAPEDGSSMSELQRYQLLMKKWKHRLDTDAQKEAGNEAGNEAGRKAADLTVIHGAGDNVTSRAQAREDEEL